MTPVRELLPENLWRAMVRQLGREEALRLLWPALLGSKLASQTGLQRIRGTTLFVSVPDAQWARSLLPLEKMILDSVNRIAGTWRATAVEFVVVPREFPVAPSQVARQEEITK